MSRQLPAVAEQGQVGLSAVPANYVFCLNLSVEATPGFEPGNEGFADPCLTTWLRGPRGPRGRNELERETGFEPATPTLARLCSTPELFPLGREG